MSNYSYIADPSLPSYWVMAIEDYLESHYGIVSARHYHNEWQKSIDTMGAGYLNERYIESDATYGDALVRIQLYLAKGSSDLFMQVMFGRHGTVIFLHGWITPEGKPVGEMYGPFIGNILRQ